MTHKDKFNLTSPGGIPFTAFCSVNPGDPGDYETPPTGADVEIIQVLADEASQQQELEEEIAAGYDVEEDALQTYLSEQENARSDYDEE